MNAKSIWSLLLQSATKEDDVCVISQEAKKTKQNLYNLNKKTIHNVYNLNRKFYSENENWKTKYLW